LKRIQLQAVLLAVSLPLLAVGCGGSSSASAGGGGGSVKLDLVAYSTPAEAYAQLIDAFKKTAAGKNVTFSESYGSSGDQSRAVEAGQPADFLHFALEPDMKRVVDAGMVAPTWNSGQYKGVLVNSVVSFIVRKGNPKGIHTWADLLKPDVEVVVANPFTSGGARWNVMAAYGAQIKLGKTPDQAVQYLYELYKHIKVQDSSARDALATFTGGRGDVLLSYENEAILAEAKGEPVEHLVPDQTILIQTVAAVDSKSKHPKEAKAWLDFLYTPQAQQIFADDGYRPVVSGVTGKYDFPQPSGLFTIDDLGGWKTVKDKFFDDKVGIMAKVEQSIGVSTSG
jgi:sulfate/thiosulfate transport system substrate-binding protein